MYQYFNHNSTPKTLQTEDGHYDVMPKSSVFLTKPASTPLPDRVVLVEQEPANKSSKK